MWYGWICLFLWLMIIKRTLSGNGYLQIRKRFIYHNGTRFVESNEVSNITFIKSFTVDFGSQYYLSTFEFKSTNMGSPVSVALHRESIQDEAIDCTDNSVQENVYNFTCANVSHFLHVISNTTLTMFDIVIRGYAAYSELFIGCYEITREEELKNASELLDCISLCNTEKIAFAGVKDGQCLCKYSFLDMNLLKIEACENSTCQEGMMCGSGDIVPMYFSDIDILLSYPRIPPQCILNKTACTRCPYGFSGPKCNNRNCSIDNGLCQNGVCNRYNSKVKVSVCLCKSGFNPTLASYCADVNECRDPTICGVISECINTHGSYECICSTGYKLNQTSKKCNDVDECERASACNKTSSKCLNTQGSFRCECLIGFEVNNASRNSCRDIDECKDCLCKEDRVCTNTFGSFFCACHQGYSKNDLLDKCLDIDECQSNKDSCDHQSTKCRNTEGSYECPCIPGFKKNSSLSCVDYDECLSSNLCVRNTKCRNLIGSYDCQCLKGYEEKSAYECAARPNDTDYQDYRETKVDKDEFQFPMEYFFFGCVALLGLLLAIFSVTMTCKSIRPVELRRVSSHSIDEEF